MCYLIREFHLVSTLRTGINKTEISEFQIVVIAIFELFKMSTGSIQGGKEHSELVMHSTYRS